MGRKAQQYRIVPVIHCFDINHRVDPALFGIGASPVAKWAFWLHSVAIDIPFEHNFGISRNRQAGDAARYDIKRLAAQRAGDIVF